MKKVFTLSIVAVFLFSCQNTKKYSYNHESTKLTWTAYKTTEKIPVEGTFSFYEVSSKENAVSAKELLESISFKVPVLKLDTKDKARDFTILDNFFNKMAEPEFIDGSITLYDEKTNTGKIKLRLNGVEKELDTKTVFSGETGEVKIEFVLNIEDFDATEVLNSLHEACLHLHKGSDGVSKTWSDVKIDVETKLDAK